MKAFCLLSSMLLSLGVMATEYRCRNYDTGKSLLLNTHPAQILLQDRFGNELDLIDGLSVRLRDLSTVPEAREISFVSIITGETAAIITEDGERIEAYFHEDGPYQCQTLK